jgi:hypothetical protein
MNNLPLTIAEYEALNNLWHNYNSAFHQLPEHIITRYHDYRNDLYSQQMVKKAEIARSVRTKMRGN